MHPKVVQDVIGSASGNSSNSSLVARINEMESQMIEGKLVLLGDDGKPLKPLVLLMWKVMVKTPYDDADFDDPGLTDAPMKFANAFDINLRGQLR
ncbi:hypothetical protein Tco_0943596 [Tanacetum coccineum]